eukprot:6924928-Alexandrium_andersonii.AAC.1
MAEATSVLPFRAPALRFIHLAPQVELAHALPPPGPLLRSAPREDHGQARLHGSAPRADDDRGH